MLPGGYFFALDLFSWSEFVRGVARRVDSLTNAITAKELEYNNAVEKLYEDQNEIDAVKEKWDSLLVKAEEAAGI
jgi:hypothetical protein